MPFLVVLLTSSSSSLVFHAPTLISIFYKVSIVVGLVGQNIQHLIIGYNSYIELRYVPDLNYSTTVLKNGYNILILLSCIPLITLHKLDPARAMPIELLSLDPSYVNSLLGPSSYNFQRIFHEVLP